MKVILNKPKDRIEDEKNFIQIDLWDTWSLDVTLAEIIIPCLKQLRDTSHGYPSNLKQFSDWQFKLDQMILAFELIRDDEFLGPTSRHYKDKNAFLGLTIVFDDAKLRRNELIIKRGLKLFAEYYQNLWD